jgi:hypothetical protein
VDAEIRVYSREAARGVVVAGEAPVLSADRDAL